jgi:hypothetical protein
MNLNNLDNLKCATSLTCPIFSLQNSKVYGKVIDIYDGDTFNIIVSYNNKLYHFKARMYGYDSP